MKTPNNNQISNTDYYKLPCGKYLIDFIKKEKLDFCVGNALKYLWRAGNKDGESKEKDMAKAYYYCCQILTYMPYFIDKENTMAMVDEYRNQAMKWDGK